jgi:DNA-binding SARP family transcriptional activator
MSLYGGSFVDGFYLRGAQSFERWVDEQRRRLERQCAEAVRRLAMAAAEQGDLRQAVTWWQRAAELNPFDTDITVRLAETWAAMGDRAAAVRHAERHQDLLRTELGLTADPRVVRLIEQLRGARE